MAWIAGVLVREREVLKQRTGDGVCLLFAGANSSGGACGATASDMQNWGLVSAFGPVSGVVPDGVAAVTVRYPASGGVQAVTSTVKVINNVFVTTIKRARGASRAGRTIVWRSANGRIIKTLRGIVGVGNSGWCGSQHRDACE
jgi:hypothetical protein